MSEVPLYGTHKTVKGIWVIRFGELGDDDHFTDPLRPKLFCDGWRG